MYSILVCDDDPDFESAWCDLVRGAATSDLYTTSSSGSGEKLRHAAQELVARASAARANPAIQRKREPCLFDNAQIVILDYDLLHVDEENAARYTGEGLARLARVFSDCGVVVVLNQFPGVQFDLSLRGHISSHADLNLDAKLLGTPGLWSGPPWDGFRPWSWQTLHRAVDTQRDRERTVDQTPDDRPIAEVLGMEEDDALRLSDSAFGFIAPAANTFAEFASRTFTDFLADAVDARDAVAAAALDRSNGDRFVAARLGKWLEREVLGPQDVLVDVPHLVERYPFLLGDDVGEVGAWNALVHDPERLQNEVPPECWFQPAEFLSRPAVWRQRFETHPDVADRRFGFDYSKVPPYAFLEDTSQFAPLSDATEFRAGHHNPFDRRFVKYLRSVRYAPQRRLAL